MEPTSLQSGSHIRVVLRDVETEAHVGLHPWERHPERPTRLIVNVEMFAPLLRPLSTESPDTDPRLRSHPRGAENLAGAPAYAVAGDLVARTRRVMFPQSACRRLPRVDHEARYFQ